MIIMICSVFLWHLCCFVCFYRFCSIVLYVFLLCCVVCCFTLANKPLSYFNDLFIPNSAIHNYNTRQASDFHISLSFSRTKSRQLSIVIYGAKSWNKLDDNLKRCRTLQILSANINNFC